MNALLTKKFSIEVEQRVNNFLQQFQGYKFDVESLGARPYSHCINTCEDWGAKSAKEQAALTSPKFIILHHMNTQNRSPLITNITKTAFQLARDCQANHMDNNGWADTGQQLTISIEGILLEGRHGSASAFLDGKEFPVGAQCEGFNSESIGIEHEGTYIDRIPGQAQLAKTINACAWICLTQDLDSHEAILGHRDKCSTQCPGDAFYQILPGIRDVVREVKLEMTKCYKKENGMWILKCGY